MSIAGTQTGEVLELVQKKFGFVPNIMQELSQAPAVIQAYMALMGAMGNSSLRPRQQQAVMLALSVNNDCKYCCAAHSTAARGLKIDPADIQAICDGGLPADPELTGVVEAARLIQTKRGKLSDEDLAALAAKGLDKPVLYELVALVGAKVITSHVDHIARLEIDKQFGG